MADTAPAVSVKVSLKEVAALTTDRQMCGVRFSPVTGLMSSGSYDATIRFWRKVETMPEGESVPPVKGAKGDSTNGWRELPPVTGHRGWVEGLAFSADGSKLFTGDTWGRLSCRRVEVAEGRDVTVSPEWEVTDAHDGWLREVSLSPDGGTLATCGRDGRLKLWNSSDGSLRQQMERPGRDLFAVRFHPTESSVVCGDGFGEVIIWGTDGTQQRTFDASDLFLEHRLQQVGGVRRMVFSPDGQTLAVGGTRPKNGGSVQGKPVVLLFNWKTGDKRLIELGSDSDVSVQDMQFLSEGLLLVVTSGSPGTGQVLCVDPGSGSVLLTEKKLANCHGVSLSSDGRHCVVTATNKGSNGNGRRLDDTGEYPGNWSPIHLFEISVEQMES
ncbi:MAG: WD40 repeat domain-containing protein [Planctomycetaceae bacterium]